MTDHEKTREELLHDIAGLRARMEVVEKRHDAELADLREAGRKYRLLTESLKDVVWTIDAETACFVYVSPSIEKCLGYTVDEMLGTHFERLLEEDSLAIIQDTMRRLIAERYRHPDDEVEHTTLELRQRRRDASLVWTKVVLTTRVNPDTGHVELVGVTRDVSERVHAQHALEASHERYRAMTDELPLVIYEADTQGRLTYFNRTAFEMFRVPDNTDIRGSTPLRFFPEADHPMVLENMRRRMHNEGTGDIVYTLIRDDGSTFPGLIISNPIIEDGELVGLRGVIIDISDRREAEEALERSEAKYRLLVDSSMEGIVVVQDGLVRHANPKACAMGGIDREELIGMPFLSLVHPEDVTSIADNFQKRLDGESVPGQMVRMMDTHGQTRWIVINAVVAPWEGKQAVLYFLHDITERKLAEDELQRINRELRRAIAEKDRFFSIIAHDLRSPFNAFLGYTEMMVEDLPTLRLDEIQAMALSMRRSAAHLYSLLENLLEWSRFKRGIMTFAPRDFTIHSEVIKAVQPLLEVARTKGVTLLTNIAGEERTSTDPNMFATTVRNLTSNAVKFTEPGGTVTITCVRLPEEHVQITVADTGIGMGRDILDRLFTLDEDIARRGTSGEPSTGLGLLLCHEFVLAMGGTIQVESTEGEGSTFRFTINPHRMCS